MKKYLFSFIITVLISTVLFAGEGKKFGKEISTKESTQISEILNQPDEFLGKTVLIEGTVLNVCKMRGCWMEIASDKEFESIVVKVEDGEIVFPMEAKGNKASVEGVFYAVEVEEENHEHKEGETCGEEGESCIHKTKKYLIKGLGAEIQM
ncbi:MAG: DUF4920 domain-containing protein [Melioribacteraceae bacterium]|nr:DUF4920 domain-containing protein [Melioribacteraceae bacterium]MCF8263174.1 DUF4920 domain-containing protein [Melioribacteraceae bacterium]MCF8414048.1 DUF4920 domain-containing protein [Melioribacteraceae bacterium]